VKVRVKVLRDDKWLVLVGLLLVWAMSKVAIVIPMSVMFVGKKITIEVDD